MAHHNTPPSTKTQGTKGRNMMIGVAAVIVLGILLFIFMSPNRSGTSGGMQQGTGAQNQTQQAAPGTGTGDPATTTPDLEPMQTVPTTQP